MKISFTHDQKGMKMPNEVDDSPAGLRSRFIGQRCQPAWAVSAACLTVGLALLGPPQCLGGNASWPQFRGPAGSGIAEGENPPTHFSANSNVLWNVEFPPG